MGIPAVLSINKVCEEIKNGDLVAVDGFKGKVIVSPTDDEIKEFEKSRKTILKIKKA